MILNLERFRRDRLGKSLTKTAARRIDEAAHRPLNADFDVFLSYSRRDRGALSAVLARLEDEHLDVYVDEMADADLDPRNVDAGTASRIRTRLLHSSALFMLTSQNATASRWVPWELGFADGAGRRVAILPFVDGPYDIERFRGTEYFGLYPWLDDTTSISDGQRYLWPTDPADSRLYTRLQDWLADEQMTLHL